ncbi:MAG: translesion error-prone DNA polymerase V subunit UmuC [Paracoccaceae bacterium]|nr:translesion error-prone DNA polymerase V subunit UmuC [Paracoccaceae bacterium]MDE2674909.1 translesion error-prone DNA polymerase V subunit UmuC [Paracoccaceae bacterium]MXZ51113.1 translesion error-prone DNA polymerase V subunit UmuC [Paracoccaceae bacterium]MYF45311.1 translesion error-prone DNA polymerase V subunit UmuC [Paracoccaceae bacterium]MYG10603.1 translesion error-prone DNA polymerase V subunit UmuC [Paracoccaceae bacterium]
MFALVDCNNFYASCERVFRPEWRKVPIAVLSNNDACLIARSDEVKELGYKLGDSYFKLRKQLQRDGVIVRSSNYALYGDLSQRVMECLEDLVPRVEVCSIDEAFLDLHGIQDLPAFGQKIARTVKRWTSIPVSVGIAPTKTLAKLANHLGKKSTGSNNVHIMEPPYLLDQIAIENVWGVGRRLSLRLRLVGIGTAQDLADLDCMIARKKFSVVLERTVRELRGESCIEIEELSPDPLHLMVSRGFKGRVTTKHQLREAVATYTSRVAEKARAKGVYAGTIQLFIRTSPFSKGPRYVNNASWTFRDPRNDNLSLVKAATRCLDTIWKEGYAYQKAGVLLTDLSTEQQRIIPLFEKAPRKATGELMRVVDRMNQRYGSETIRIASSGTERPWMMSREFLSPSYTTRWKDIPTVRA